MAEEPSFRDPARRRLFNVTDEAQAAKGELQTDLPDVDVPSQFDTPIQSTGIRADVMAGVQGQFDENIAQIQESALQSRRFRAGSTSAAELREARASRGRAIGALGQVELQSQGQILQALSPLAQTEAAGEQQRETLGQEQTFEQQRVDIEARLAGVQEEQARLMGVSITIDQGRLNLDRDALAESVRQFDMSTEEGIRQFNATIAESARNANLDREQTAELAANALEEGMRQFDMTDKTQRDLAGTALAENARQFNLSQDQTRELAEAQLAETARQFDLSEENDMDQFTQEIAERARQFDLDQDQTATLAANTLAEQARQFDFSEAQALDIHMDNIAEMQRQFDLTDNQVRDLAADALSENIRQFDLTSAQDMEMFGQNLQETARQFNMSHAQTARLAAEPLTQQKDIAEQGLKVQHVANMLNFMIEGAEALTVQDGINILDMAFEMSDIEKELGITPEQTASVSRVISEVSNEGTDGQRLHAALNDPSIWAGGADHDQDILDQLDFNFDGVIDNSDYILYRAGGGQFEFETELG